MIGDTGIVVVVEDITPIFSSKATLPAETPPEIMPGWRGVFIKRAAIFLPPGMNLPLEGLAFENCYIGSGGFTGQVAATWTTDPPMGDLGGVTFALTAVQLGFRQNVPTESQIHGRLTLPFFDEPLDLVVAIGLNGKLMATLTGEQGLATLTKPGILSIEIDSLGLALEGGLLTASLSGQVTPLFGGLGWPAFEVKELAIDSKGNVRLEGGWLDLREQYSLDFHGFQLEITKLGFGKTEDGGKWVGCSGGLKLVDGMAAGASVEGLRVTWYDDGRAPKITFEGVGVEFEVPGVLRFKGAVAYRELEVDGAVVHRFDGDIRLDLLALAVQVDGTLVLGSTGAQGAGTFMALYLNAELPAGIPLWATGLALYGMAGLFALQMEPDKRADESWYENLDGSPGWYKRPALGVTDLPNKWVPRAGSLALGAGVTLGTAADNGFAFSGRMLLVIVFPGPVLLIEGRANILRERAKLDQEPTFRALAVLDNRAGALLIGLDAQYRFAGQGELVDIRGGAEAFFDFDDAGAWHLYLGRREPRERRIQAELFQLFTANTYLMLDAEQLALGAWQGYQKQWTFGPLKVVLESWIESNAVVSWKPAHFYGDLWLHGRAELTAFGFGIGLSVDARLAADVFDPFHVLGELSAGINLPWPLPDIAVDITLEWGPIPTPPPLPVPLKEIAVEHFKVTTSWPLPRGNLLRPNYDGNGDGFVEPLAPTVVAAQAGAPPPDNLPVVPMDSRPHLTFTRPVHDDALVGVNVQPMVPEYERIGDPAQNKGPLLLRSSLQEVALHKHGGTTWQLVARRGPTANPAGIPELYGSWAPMPHMPDGDGENAGQVKLWLWSKTPFDYTRHSGGAWDDWFTDRFEAYPCIEIPKDQEFCYDFEKLPRDQPLIGPWAHPDEPRLVFRWQEPRMLFISALAQPVAGLRQALCFPGSIILPNGKGGPNPITIELPQPAKAITLTLVDAKQVRVTGYDGAGKAFGPVFSQPKEPHVRLEGEAITRVVILGGEGPCLLRVCFIAGLNEAQVAQRQEMRQHLVAEAARWSQVGDVLEPHTTYRLTVVTRLHAQGEAELAGYSQDLTQTEFAYFRTEGPPGLTTLLPPIDHPPTAEFDSGLSDLARYVRQTMPPTVPPPGSPPLLPRPVYRAYDVGVEFNEDYIELMYRLARRDLQLYLYDANNRPVRDAQGRLIILSNRWGVAEHLTLTPGEARWIAVANGDAGDGCAPVKAAGIPHDQTLTSAAPGQVLDLDTVYEARLTPLLLREDFSRSAAGVVPAGPAGVLPGWQVRDEGTVNRPSRWEIRQSGTPPARYVIQTNGISGGASAPQDPVKPGTLLLLADAPIPPPNLLDQPGAWTDYRVSLLLRSESDGAIGVVFRYVGTAGCYRFSMDRAGGYRRLVRMAGRAHTILAEDHFVYQQNQDYLITIEAVGGALRVYQDGAPVFAVSDAAYSQGRIGLYCWKNAGARFGDLRVDDLRGQAPVVYRFQFITSRFTNFFHHLHSFQDETWLTTLAATVDISALVAQAAAPATPPTDAEARAYQALAAHRPGAAAAPPEVQVTRVEQNGQPLAFFVHSPEPIDWKRTDLQLLRANHQPTAPEPPGSIKLTGVTFGTAEPSQESVTLLLREPCDLTGQRIEYERQPGPLIEPPTAHPLFQDRFLAGDTLGWSFVDEGTTGAPSQWVAAQSVLRQTKAVHSPLDRDPLRQAGTQAIAGDPAWRDVIIRVRLQSLDDDAIGLLFRYQDPNHYYRFSMSRRQRYRRLVKNSGGTFRLLWEDSAAYELRRPYELLVVAVGNTLRGYLDETLVFAVEDSELQAGRLGLYCSANTDAQFAGVRVYPANQVFTGWVLDEPFERLARGRWSFVDEDERGGRSQWQVSGGELRQTSRIAGGSSNAKAPDKPGTYALAGDATWTDYRVDVRLRSDADGAIGVLFRYQDRDNYYRFSMDRAGNYRRLVQKWAGVVRVLWQEAFQYMPGREYVMTVSCVGQRLAGFLDGQPLFALEDGALAAGGIGLYCWANPQARFAEVRVATPVRLPYYTFGQEAPLSAGTLVRVYSGNPAGAPADEPGLVRRFITAAQEQPYFSAEGTRLHISAPNGTSGHARTFLPDGTFAPVQAQVLRSADGIGFFIVVPTVSAPGTRLERGIYRMKLTYRRNNQTSDPDSPVLSEAGNSDPEHLSVDIPWGVVAVASS